MTTQEQDRASEGDTPPSTEEVRDVQSKRIIGPSAGFGKLWQKTYRMQLRGATVTAREVIATWKERFPEFWPPGNEFYAPFAAITPGELAIIKLDMPGEGKLTTGVYVLRADDVSFTLLTPEGHMFAGRIDFQARDEPGGTVVQVDVLMRANDPLYELGLALGGHTHENDFWEQTLQRLAAFFGVTAEIETRMICLDRGRQWSNIGNIRHNAGLHSALHALARPVRWATKQVGRLGDRARARPHD